MSSAAQAEQLGHLYAELVNARAIDRFGELIAPDYVNHNPYVEQGLAGAQAFFTHFLGAVPDLRVTAHAVFATDSGSHTVGRYTYEGTHLGPFLGRPPTGKPFQMRSIDIWRVEDGRFVEHWDELNTLDIFVQIGAAHLAT
ncbi:MAG: ester cyclase [Acetobacteraceae bacterium]|nr:ester cyclase [Acetobacteraceae bacterium]